ncbi:Neuropilin and tolloid-like protein 1 [Aphelenchoides bicaudatus]|nr:Neuropilin and tolloid-like protein 1 [Aphelenchoides bicaudatus]
MLQWTVRLEWNGQIAFIFVLLNLVNVASPDDWSEGMTPHQQCQAFQTGGMERMAEFASPNYPQNYPPNVDCIRVIHSPPNYDIVFRFHEVFRIETSYEDSLAPARAISPNCPNDYLEIRDGRYSFSPLIGRFCGLEAPQEEIRVRSGYAWLNFHSDSLLEDRGFSAEYEFVRRAYAAQKNPQECHFSHVLQLDGYINVTALSDFYEAGRPANQPLECVYQIRVPNWLRVALFIERFELAAPNQCAQNFLEIYAGGTAREPLKRYCGIIATHTYTSTSVVFVRLFVASQFHAMNTRLKILFSSYLAQKNCSESELFECGDDICIPKSLVCNQRSNCLYRRDEMKCNEYKNVKALLLDLPLILLPVLIAGILLLLALVYKPWMTTSLSSQILSVEAKEGTPLTANKRLSNATSNAATTTRRISKPETVNSGSKRTSLSIQQHQSRNPSLTPQPTNENGQCRRASSKGPDVWQALQDVEIEIRRNGQEEETSFVSIDV